MRQDFSWDRSAREYVKLYESARGRPRAYIGTVFGRVRGVLGFVGTRSDNGI